MNQWINILDFGSAKCGVEDYVARRRKDLLYYPLASPHITFAGCVLRDMKM